MGGSLGVGCLVVDSVVRGPDRLSAVLRRPDQNGRVEQREQDEGNRCGAEQVPGPRSQNPEKRPLAGGPSEEHVVGTGQPVHQSDQGGVGHRYGENSKDGSTPRRQAQSEDQKRGGEDDAQVSDHVLPKHEMGEPDRQIRGQHALQRAGQAPEVGELDQYRHPPETGGRRQQHGHIAEGKRKEVLADQVPARARAIV